MTLQAAAEYRQAAGAGPIRPQGVWHRGRAEALEGKRAEALATIEELKRMAASRYVAPSHVATILVWLGDKDGAFEWLHRACEGRACDIVFIRVDPVFDGLRDDPRFADPLRRAGLEPGAR